MLQETDYDKVKALALDAVEDVLHSLLHGMASDNHSHPHKPQLESILGTLHKRVKTEAEYRHRCASL